MQRGRGRIAIFLAFALAVSLAAAAYHFGFQTGLKKGLAGAGAGRDQTPALSKAGVIAVAAASSLSPGIVLLAVAYHVKKKMNADGRCDWFLRWLWLFWILALADVTLDMIPGAATVNRFFEYALIWFIAWIGATILNSGVSLLLAGLAGSGLQVTRQAYSLATDYGTGGLGAPARSMAENIVAVVLAKLIL